MEHTEVLPDIFTLPEVFGVLCISALLWWKGEAIQVEMASSVH